MHAPAPITSDRPASAPWSTAFITRLHRYKALLQRRWWIPVLTICLGLFVQAWLIYQTPPSFESRSKMMLAGKMNISQGAVYSEDNVNFYGTQIQLMQSQEVRHSAEQLVRSTHPEMQPVQVEITVMQKPRTSIFDLIAIGSTPDYTQAYLNAVMQKYLDFKKGMRENQGSTVTTAITEQLIQVEKDLRSAEDEMIEFQKQNNIGFITEEGNSAAQYLVRLNQQYAQLKTEYDLLSLLDLDQNLDRAQGKGETPTAPSQQSTDDKSSGMAFSDVGPEADYLKANAPIIEGGARNTFEGPAPQTSQNHQAQRRGDQAGKADRTLPAGYCRKARHPAQIDWQADGESADEHQGMGNQSA